LKSKAKDTAMHRSLLLIPLVVVTLSGLAACGSDHTTVYAPAGSTVIVPNDGGKTKIITPGD
jgi:predicted small lipoprotein YifL